MDWGCPFTSEVRFLFKLLPKYERLSAVVPAILAVLMASLACASAVRAQTPQGFPFRATYYEVEVLLHPEDQTISGQAKVEFIAQQPGRTVVVELHQDLRVNSVKLLNGGTLEFERDNRSPLLLTIGLPDVVSPGKTVTLVFDYTGPVSSEEDSPTRGVRLASVDKTGAYLLLPARWFPLTNYPTNRYTGKFKIDVPDTFAVTGTGKADLPTMQPGIGKGAPGTASYVFHCDHAGPVGTFVAGNLQLAPVQSEGFNVSVFTPPAQANTASSYATSLAHIVSYFSDVFGPLDMKENDPPLTIAQLPDGTVPGFAAPGVMLISARQWGSRANDRLLSQLAAEQWWGDRVLPSTASDVWLTDGLSRYAEAMYAEQSDGSAGLHKALEDFAVGALMYEDTAPIAQAARLQTFSNEYRSVVADKGALVFHMLRTELGDDAFNALLRDFYKKYEGKNVSLNDFEKMAMTKIPPPVRGQPPVNLVSFFSQWLNSTGVPEFKMEYIVYRTQKGFKVVGKIHQDLDTFRMPVMWRATAASPRITTPSSTPPLRSGRCRSARASGCCPTPAGFWMSLLADGRPRGLFPGAAAIRSTLPITRTTTRRFRPSPAWTAATPTGPTSVGQGWPHIEPSTRTDTRSISTWPPSAVRLSRLPPAAPHSMPSAITRAIPFADTITGMSTWA